VNPNFLNTYFTTLTINRYISVFKDFPDTNCIILDSFNHLVDNEKVKIYSFVIMRDHIHMVWEMVNEDPIDDIITSFKKHTGREIMKYLSIVNVDYLNDYFTSIRKDRKYKIWKQSKGNLRIDGQDILINKIKYIHENPIKGDYKQVEKAEDYTFSSAKAYRLKSSNFRFLTVIDNY